MVAIPTVDSAAVEQAQDSGIPSFSAEQPQFSIYSPENGSQPPDAVAPEPSPELPAEPPSNSPDESSSLPHESAAAGDTIAEAEKTGPQPDPAAEKAALEANRQAKYEERLQEAERDYLEACCDRDRIEAEIAGMKGSLKLAKEHAETCYGRLIDIRNKTPQQMELGLAGDNQESPEEDEDETDEEAGEETDETEGAEASAAADKNDPNWWRAVPITEIGLEEIEGFKAKKREKLIEAVPTVGDMEDLRTKAAAANEPPSKFFPKGIGKQSADVIIERLLVWLTANRDQEAFAAATGGVDAIPDDHEQQVIARARELWAMSPIPDPQYGAIAEDGRTAAKNDNPITDCGWTASDKQDSWLIGWLSERSLPA